MNLPTPRQIFMVASNNFGKWKATFKNTHTHVGSLLTHLTPPLSCFMISRGIRGSSDRLICLPHFDCWPVELAKSAQISKVTGNKFSTALCARHSPTLDRHLPRPLQYVCVCACMCMYVFSELVPGQRLAKCLLKCGHHLARLIAVYLCLDINYSLHRV